MKKLTLQVSMVMLATYAALFVKPQSASAQVDMSLLTEVAKSCQKDTRSSEYYEQMGFDENEIKSEIGSDNSLNNCIYARYYHSLLQSKFPWLTSMGEMIPGYPGSVAVSLMSSSDELSSLLDCLVNQDPSSNQCANSIKIFADDKINNGYNISYHYTYVCPSCAVAHDNVRSAKKMKGSFIKWFLNLDKPTRRKVMSILGESQNAESSRSEIRAEANRASTEYFNIRQRVEKQEQDRRRREVIGN